MYTISEQKTRFEKDELNLWDGFAWRKCRKITCEDCGISWYVRLDRKGEYKFCLNCIAKRRRKPLVVKPPKIKLSRKVMRISRLQQRKSWAFQYKGSKCSVCGISDLPLPCYHFHHLKDKKYQISHIFQNKKWKEMLIEELTKCILICANCHITLHSKERLYD